MEDRKGSLLSGFQVGLASGRYLHEIREWEESGVRLLISRITFCLVP